ncbi:hypothetical protein MUG91_G70n42 [Manis pentadactyla]|nr:hypothetical protein MUG91_G70n42 [Manis pentadactyla]
MRTVEQLLELLVFEQCLNFLSQEIHSRVQSCEQAEALLRVSAESLQDEDTGSEAREGQADIVIQCTDLPHRSSILQFGCPLDLHAKNNNVFSSNANCDGALLHAFLHVFHFEEVATG